MSCTIKLKSGKEIVLKGQIQDEFIYEGDVTEEDINEIVKIIAEKARQERRVSSYWRAK